MLGLPECQSCPAFLARFCRKFFDLYTSKYSNWNQNMQYFLQFLCNVDIDRYTVPVKKVFLFWKITITFLYEPWTIWHFCCMLSGKRWIDCSRIVWVDIYCSSFSSFYSLVIFYDGTFSKAARRIVSIFTFSCCYTGCRHSLFALA